jgi:hypothetical protein
MLQPKKKIVKNPVDDYKNMKDPATGRKGTMGGEGKTPPLGKGDKAPKSAILPKRTYVGGKPAKNGKTISKAKNGKSFPDLNKDGKVTKADILKGRGVIAKKGATIKKAQYGSAMGAVRGIMNDTQKLNKEKMDRKKAKTPSSPPTSKRPDSNMSTPYSTSGVNPAIVAKSGKIMKKVKAKSGASMKKCKYGCK